MVRTSSDPFFGGLTRTYSPNMGSMRHRWSKKYLSPPTSPVPLVHSSFSLVRHKVRRRLRANTNTLELEFPILPDARPKRFSSLIESTKGGLRIWSPSLRGADTLSKEPDPLEMGKEKTTEKRTRKRSSTWNASMNLSPILSSDKHLCPQPLKVREKSPSMRKPGVHVQRQERPPDSDLKIQKSGYYISAHEIEKQTTKLHLPIRTRGGQTTATVTPATMFSVFHKCNTPSAL